MTSTEVDKDVSKSLGMSLDDIIKEKKAGSSRGGSRGGRAPRGGSYGGRSTGPVRRTFARGAYRPVAPYAAPKPTPMVTEGLWQHDMFAGAAVLPVPMGALETGTKLYVSNLDFGVSNEDITELFSECGDLKKCSVNYDRSGRSKGTAEVVFARKADAVRAMAKYNNVLLDKKPMKIELIGTNLTTVTPQARLGPTSIHPVQMKRSIPVTAASNRAALAASYEQQHQSQAQGFRPKPAFTGGFRGGRGRGGGGGRFNRRNQVANKTQEELDAELDSYHAEKGSNSDAMQT